MKFSSLASSTTISARRGKSQKNTPKIVVDVREHDNTPSRWLAVTPCRRKVRLGVIADQAEFDLTVSSIMLFQCMASSSTAVYTLAYAIKVRKVSIWFMSNALSTNKNATIEWNAASTGFLMPGRALGSTSSSTTEYSCLTSKPPRQSLASWYQGGPNAYNNVLMSLSAPAGAIIEFDYDWVPNYTEAAISSPASVSGATTGIVYCRGINSNILALPPLNSAI